MTLKKLIDQLESRVQELSCQLFDTEETAEEKVKQLSSHSSLLKEKDGALLFIRTDLYP